MARSIHRRFPSSAVVALLAVVGTMTCWSAAWSSAATNTSRAVASVNWTASISKPVDPTAIPLGDGHVSSKPKINYVDSCVTKFSNQAGGAFRVGPWINLTKKTWNSVTKVAVVGSVRWSSASFTVATNGTRRLVTTNDLPTDHTTGIFPVGSTDPAFNYDRNPNSIKAQSFSWSLPLSPVAAKTPRCLGLGLIGVLNDGVVLFDALDGEGRDAGAHETLDSYGGHPQQSEIYHHHAVPNQVIAGATASSTLVGYATDGYGIFVERSANGALLTNAQLDVCHGRTSKVLWNGTVQSVYHYDATMEYPYTLGCFHGSNNA